jgi:hypothetical protein
MSNSKVINVFTSGHCIPCQEFKKMVAENKVDIDAEPGSTLNIVDIETEEGFTTLSKTEGDVTGIPAAQYNGQSCRIEVKGERIIIRCPKPPVAPETV